MSFVDRQACMLVFLLAALGCLNESARQSTVVFRDAQGRLLSPEDLQKETGSLHYEVYDGEAVPVAAKALHQQAREAGERGNYEEALVLLTRAASLAPRWPYPVYDRAYTHLLMKSFDAALADYRRTADLAPRGFFTTLTAVDTLVREQKGEFPQGLYLAYLMLEPIQDAAQAPAPRAIRRKVSAIRAWLAAIRQSC